MKHFFHCQQNKSKVNYDHGILFVRTDMDIDIDNNIDIDRDT